MKKLFLASAAALALATAGVAHAAGNGCPKQLAASGIENQQGQTNVPSSQLAASGKPEVSGSAKSQLAAAGIQNQQGQTNASSQLAASGKPETSTTASSQLAASGKPEASTNAGAQLAAGGGLNPNSRQLAASGIESGQGKTNVPSTQLASSGKPEPAPAGSQLAAINPDCK